MPDKNPKPKQNIPYEKAVALAKKAGVKFPSIVAAQMGLETGWGKTLVAKNNPFNMHWDEASAKKMRAEGIVVTKSAKKMHDGNGDYYFMEFNNLEEGFKGYNSFIHNNPRYTKALSATTPEEYIKELGKAGYALDKEYVSKILNIAKQQKPEKVFSKDNVVEQKYQELLKESKLKKPNMDPLHLIASTSFELFKDYSKKTKVLKAKAKKETEHLFKEKTEEYKKLLKDLDKDPNAQGDAFKRYTQWAKNNEEAFGKGFQDAIVNEYNKPIQAEFDKRKAFVSGYDNSVKELNVLNIEYQKALIDADGDKKRLRAVYNKYRTKITKAVQTKIDFAKIISKTNLNDRLDTINKLMSDPSITTSKYGELHTEKQNLLKRKYQNTIINDAVNEKYTSFGPGSHRVLSGLFVVTDDLEKDKTEFDRDVEASTQQLFEHLKPTLKSFVAPKSSENKKDGANVTSNTSNIDGSLKQNKSKESKAPVIDEVKQNSQFDNFFNNDVPVDLKDVPETVSLASDFKRQLPIDALGSALLGISALKDANNEDVPKRDEKVSQAVFNFVEEQKNLSKLGLRPEEELAVRQGINEAYQVGLNNITKASGGNRNLVLGNLSKLNESRLKGLTGLAVADAQAKQKALESYGKSVQYINEFNARRNIANSAIDLKEFRDKRIASGQLASTAFQSMINSIQDYKENAPGSINHMLKTAFIMNATGNNQTEAGIARAAKRNEAIKYNIAATEQRDKLKSEVFSMIGTLNPSQKQNVLERLNGKAPTINNLNAIKNYIANNTQPITAQTQQTFSNITSSFAGNNLNNQDIKNTVLSGGFSKNGLGFQYDPRQSLTRQQQLAVYNIGIDNPVENVSLTNTNPFLQGIDINNEKAVNQGLLKEKIFNNQFSY